MNHWYRVSLMLRSSLIENELFLKILSKLRCGQPIVWRKYKKENFEQWKIRLWILEYVYVEKINQRFFCKLSMLLGRSVLYPNGKIFLKKWRFKIFVSNKKKPRGKQVSDGAHPLDWVPQSTRLYLPLFHGWTINQSEDGCFSQFSRWLQCNGTVSLLHLFIFAFKKNIFPLFF